MDEDDDEVGKILREKRINGVLDSPAKPIDLIWAQVKDFVRKRNAKFTMVENSIMEKCLWKGRKN